MRVLMVWDGNYPWDVRVEKILGTLNAWGHDTHLVCRNSNARPRRELHQGTHLRRLFAFQKKGLSKLNPLINFPAFFSPIWKSEIRRAIREIKPDLVIIRDLPIAAAVIPAARKANVPMILDMAECYPELIRCVWQFDRFSFANIFVRNPYLADAVERYVIREVDLIWVMIEESGQRLLGKGVPPGKIVKVSNTPPAVFQEETAQVVQDEDGILEVVYVGLLNPSRGIATVIEAARILKARGAHFRMQIIGSGKDSARLAQMVNTWKLEGHVKLLGWMERKDAQKLLDKADVGLVPHHLCTHWNSTIPNKLFDYMKARIPVVVSDVKPAARIVRDTECGLVFRSGDAGHLAEQLLQLMDQQTRARMGAAGRAAVAREYNWENDSNRMRTSMTELAAQNP